MVYSTRLRRKECAATKQTAPAANRPSVPGSGTTARLTGESIGAGMAAKLIGAAW